MTAATRVPYAFLTSAERTAIESWLKEELLVDPARTPINPLLEYDPRHGEWRVEQFWLDDRGRMRLDESGEDVRRVVLRRRGSPTPPPWPTTTVNPPARVWIGDVEVSNYVTAVEIGPER